MTTANTTAQNVTIESIEKMVSSFRGSTEFTRLRKRWDDDFRLWYLFAYDAGAGYASYTSNAPRNLATKSISMLQTARLVIRCPDITLQKQERVIANNNERFIYGAIVMNDDRYTRIDEPTIHAQLAWYLIVRGSVAVRTLVKKEPDGSTFPEIAIWDIYNTTYVVGRKGLYKACHTRTATRESIMEEYGIDIEKDTGTIYDYWDEKVNAVMCEQIWLKEPTPHGLDYCPVAVLKSGAMPTVWQENDAMTNIHRGESIFASNRNLYPIVNKVLSDYVTIVHRGVKVPLGYWSAGGTKNLDRDIWQVDEAFSVPLDSTMNEKIEPLMVPSVPADAKTLLQFVLSEDQKGGISDIGMGQLGFRLSGFAINQLQSALATVINPFVEALTQAYKFITVSLLQQYAKGNFADVAMRGRDSKNQAFGVVKPEYIGKDDINANWEMSVQIMPTFPKDDAQRYELARIATDGNKPLLSVRTAQEEIIGVEDVDWEQEKLAMEWSTNLPLVKLTEAFEAALKDGDFVKAEAIKAELTRMMNGALPQGSSSSPKSFGAPRPNNGVAENPGVGLPPGETGLSSSTMPSESMGGLPSGAEEQML